MHRRWLWLVQGAVTVLVVAFAAKVLTRNWSELRGLDVVVRIRPGWLLLSAGAVAVAYIVQIESWRRILAGWSQPLAFATAARIWCVANLARYVPGKVWSIAGLVVLAQRAGVPAGVTTASSVAIQALGLGSGVVVAVASVPRSVPALGLAAAAAIAVLTTLVLVWEAPVRWLARLLGSTYPLRTLPWRAAAAAGTFTTVGWVTYGVAFWLLAHGLLAIPAPPLGLPVVAAVGVFALGYILGWVALLAPGGLGVRELALVGLLTPFLGGGDALAVTLASRVLLTLTELGAALITMAVGIRPKESPVDPH